MTRIPTTATCLLGVLLVFVPCAHAQNRQRTTARRDTSRDNQVQRGIVVDCDFPGGNIIVERIDGDKVLLRQDQRDTPGFWFYWYFRVRGADGRTLCFKFTNGNPIGVRGPAISTDGGNTWSWLGRESVNNASFRCTFAEDAKDVRFSFGMPYTQHNWETFLARYQENHFIEQRDLAVTRKGRKNKYCRVGRLDGKADYRVLLTCRHHCCEMMASYTLEGIIESVLAESPDGKWFREHVEFLVVPLVDLDGVEDGDQGKNRKPHDHNRDYAGASIYPSIRAIRQLVPKWSRGRLKIACDLHCPWIRGPHNEVIYMVGSSHPAIWKQQTEFGKVLEAVQTGPLVYSSKDNLPFGTAWNTGNNYGSGKSCSRWASDLEGIRLASTLEIPYANAAGNPVTTDSARAFGVDLARAIRRYIEPPQGRVPCSGRS